MSIQLVVLLFLFYIVENIFSEACERFEINKYYLNKRLIGHRIKEMFVDGRNDCIRECFYLSKCKSTDFNEYNLTCKLNDVDSSSVEMTEFEDRKSSTFSDITAWPKAIAGTCSERPCSNTERCLPGKNTYGCIKLETESDCTDIKRMDPLAPDGVYEIKLWRSRKEKSVYCEMTTDGGGWTVLQYRFNGSVNFTRNFANYTDGFGNLKTEFWQGLNTVQEMSSRGASELRIDITAADETSVYIVHKNFYLDKRPAFTLHIDRGTGTADPSGMSYHNDCPFSTYDAEVNDKGFNCAFKNRGGWWYHACAAVNLNGEYVTPGTERPNRAEGGMIYKRFKGSESLKTSRMMFRRV